MIRKYIYRYYVLLFLGLFCVANASAQISNLLFNSSVTITALNFDTPEPSINYIDIAGGVSVEAISHAEDSNGNIIFFVISNGVFRPDGTQMPGSVGLFANTSSTEMNICQVPGETNKYYIIYQESDLCTSLYYSIVDMSLAGGIGDVSDLNILLDSNPHAEGMEIVRIPGTDEYWYLAYQCSTGLERYKIDASGIGPAEEILAITPPPTSFPFPGATELDYHNGKVVWGFYTTNQSVIVDFDPLTGIASNPVTIEGVGSYGAEFSEDASKVYLSDLNTLYQYDIATATLTDFPLTNCDGFPTVFGQIELGGDGNIYIINFGDCITKIEDTNTTSPVFSNIFVDFELSLGVSDHIQSDILSILEVDAIVEDVTCYGEATGSITVNILSGEAPFDIQWSHDPDNSSTTLNNLNPGNYTLTITDNNLNVVIENYTIEQADLLLATTDIKQPLCFGDNGSIELIISGGTPPYLTDWNGVDPSNVPNGNYTVSVSDANNCNLELEYAIIQYAALEAVLSINDALCFGAFGNVSIEINGGRPPYQIDLEGQNIEFLPAGSYNYTVRDSNDCTISDSYTITEPEAIEIEISFTQFDCNEVSAIAETTVSGGVPPYEINWFGYDTNNLPAGKYKVEVTDQNNCIRNKEVSFIPSTVNVFVPNAFSPNGDALNDEFLPVIDCYSSFEMNIYDRWGKFIFNTSSFEKPWDGNYKGEKLPSGVYIYELQVVSATLELKKQSGHISLIR